MAVVEWTREGDAWLHGAFLVAPVPSGDSSLWRLETVAEANEVFDRSPADFVFHSLSSAKAFALHCELVSVRRTKRFRHTFLAPVLATVATAMFVFGAFAPGRGSLVMWLLALGVVFLAFREMTYAIPAWAASWDYHTEMPSLSPVDRAVSSVATRVATARERRRTLEPDEGSVRIVPIDAVPTA